jgi:hypothetical protein
VGAQIGATEIDGILVIMNRSASSICFQTRSNWAPKRPPRRDQSAGRVKRQPTCRCTRRFSAIRAAEDCLPASRSTARSSRKTWMPIRAWCQRRRSGEISSGHDASRRRGRRSSAEGPGSLWESAERGRTRRGGCQGAPGHRASLAGPLDCELVQRSVRRNQGLKMKH